MKQQPFYLPQPGGGQPGLSFSQQVKEELNRASGRNVSCQPVELAIAIACAHQQTESAIVMSTSNASYAGLIVRLVLERYHREPELSVTRETLNITLSPSSFISEIGADLAACLGMDPTSVPFRLDPARLASCSQAVLRTCFLASGSIRDPYQAYHLEFDLRREDVAHFLSQYLAALGIRSAEIKRHGHPVVYIKEGQQISEFLLRCGAHQSLLAFESLRVEKEMRNSVNRVVNCDSANSTRIAHTAARQLELLRELEMAGLLSQLPEELAAAATARLRHPDLSLKELGETMVPPLGKSGMNHRLRKLEQLAMDRLHPQEELPERSGSDSAAPPPAAGNEKNEHER